MLHCIVRPHHQRELAASHQDHKVTSFYVVIFLIWYCLHIAAHTPRRSPLPPEPSPITPLGEGHPIKQQQG